MPLKFDITLTAEDMYRFNMYQTYSGFHGWFSIAFSILIFVVAGVTRGKIEAAYTALYIVFGIVFLVYPPVSLYLRSKRTLAMSEVLRGCALSATRRCRPLSVRGRSFTGGSARQSRSSPSATRRFCKKWTAIYEKKTSENSLVFSF